MHSNTASSDHARSGIVLALLVAGSLLLRPLESRLSLPDGAPDSLHGEQLTSLAGRGSLLAVLGGMRAAVASGFWLKANAAWEKRDPAATTALIELTVAADERPLYFWLNGARILAYDLPEWSLPASLPAAVRQRVVDEHAQRALRFLEKGVRWHGPDAAFYVEMGNIHLRRTGDLESAARCYRLAAQQVGAPYYAARIHAELLRAMGRKQEALDWLRGLLPRLPANDPAACRNVVEQRIKVLELQVAGK